MMRVGFIGTGHIAAPMARTIARAGHKVTVSRRNEAVSAGLADAGVGIEVADNQGVLDTSDVVFLCLRPGVWEGIAAGLVWRADHRIVSPMSGVSLSSIRNVCQPVTHVSSTIPLGFLEQGGCPLPVLGPAEPLQSLLGATNPLIPVADEAQMADYFAASALLSALLGIGEAGAEWLGARTGHADAGEQYVANLFAGFLAALPRKTAGEMKAHKWDLATPNTLNLQMVEGLTEAGAYQAIGPLLTKISTSMEPKP